MEVGNCLEDRATAQSSDTAGRHTGDGNTALPTRLNILVIVDQSLLIFYVIMIGLYYCYTSKRLNCSAIL